jgi:oligosaccharyltransferase complex subunit gamma
MRLNIWKLLILAIALVSVYSHPKGDQLRKMTKNSKYGVINLNAQNFNEYVMKHPRPYDVVILFTLKMKCTLCEMVRNEFEQVSDSFVNMEGFKPDITAHHRAVFFVVVYYSEDTTTILKKLKLPATTSILYTTPYNILVDDSNEPYIKYDEDFVIAYKDRGDNVMAHKILEFGNAKSGRKFELKKNPFIFIVYFVAFISVLILGFILFKNFKGFFLSPILWYVGSCAVYIICIGGIVYNMIHGAPFAKFDREGRVVEWIHSGQRSQYVGEGIFMSSLFVVIGTLFASLSWVPRLQSDWHVRIVAIVLIFATAFFSKVVIMVYQKKAPWYGPTFYPPGGYIQGPLIKDQGNSF